MRCQFRRCRVLVGQCGRQFHAHVAFEIAHDLHRRDGIESVAAEGRLWVDFGGLDGQFLSYSLDDPKLDLLLVG